MILKYHILNYYIQISRNYSSNWRRDGRGRGGRGQSNGQRLGMIERQMLPEGMAKMRATGDMVLALKFFDGEEEVREHLIKKLRRSGVFQSKRDEERLRSQHQAYGTANLSVSIEAEDASSRTILQQHQQLQGGGGNAELIN